MAGVTLSGLSSGLDTEGIISGLGRSLSTNTEHLTGLLQTEGVKIEFTKDALEEIASLAVLVNERTENIGARRLFTIMEKLLEELSFEAPDLKKKSVKIDAAYVNKQLADIVKNQDLSRYIL